MPKPVDPSRDFTQITPERVEVGSVYLFTQEAAGRITDTIPFGDPNWLWFAITALQADGTTASTTILVPKGPLGNQPVGSRYYAWKRQNRPALGAVFTMGDGSKWIYSGPNPQGSYQCYSAGTVHQKRERGNRSQLTGTATIPPELDLDPAFEWVPVNDSTTIAIGNTCLFLQEILGTVRDITPNASRWGFNVEKADATFSIAYVHNAAISQRVGVREYVYRATPKPAVDSKFRADDGSKWIYSGDSGGALYCWSSGSVYTAGSEYLRGDIAGGLISI